MPSASTKAATPMPSASPKAATTTTSVSPKAPTTTSSNSISSSNKTTTPPTIGKNTGSYTDFKKIDTKITGSYATFKMLDTQITSRNSKLTPESNKKLTISMPGSSNKVVKQMPYANIKNVKPMPFANTRYVKQMPLPGGGDGKSLERGLNALQTVLDGVGLVPGFGEIADGANAVIYTARGDKINAGLSLAACIPIAGWAATGGKAINKGIKAVDATGVIVKNVSKEATEKVVKEATEKGTKVVSEGTSGALKGGSKADVLKQNKLNGDAFEKSLSKELKKKQNDVVSQITIKTDSGVKTRVDFVGKDKATGNINLTEAKSSSTAPLTKNQKNAYPEIEKNGGIIVGKGKEPYTGGTQIPPTKVDVRRK
jgi:hypothetical protein